MRPKKIRWIKCDAAERSFKPETTRKSGASVSLTLDEFEAVRLLDHQGMSQVQASAMMKVHRSTVSRIISSARRKIAQALVEIRELKIEGGCCKVAKGRSI